MAALLMAAPLTAQARPGEGPGPEGRGGWYQSIPQEKRDAVQKLILEHREKTQPIRDQLWAKSRTLDALSGNSKVEPKEIRDLVDEMVALRAQLREQHKAFAAQVQQEAGVTVPIGRCGMGYGGHRGHDGLREHGYRGGHGGHHGGMTRR